MRAKLPYPLIFILAFIALVYVSQALIQNFPNSADEYAYIFQAKNLAKGELYTDLHPKAENGYPLQQYFYFVHIGETDGKYYGRFPFGYSLLLVPSVWIEWISGFDTYWLVNILLGIGTLYFIYHLAGLLFPEPIALASLLIAAFSPWFLFTSGSFFSHSACTFFLSVFLWSLVKYCLSGKTKLLVYCAAAFGFAVWCRLLDPLAFLIPGLCLYLTLGSKQTVARDLTRGFLYGLPFLVIFLLYNLLLTGNALETPYQYFNPNDSGTRFIFLDPDTNYQTYKFSRVVDAWLGNSRPNLRSLAEWFPAVYFLLLLPFAVFLSTLKNLKIVFSLVLVPVFVILLYTLYGGPPINQYGPRYFYSMLPVLSILCGFSIVGFSGNKKVGGLITLVVLVWSLFNASTLGKEISANIFERRNIFRTAEACELDKAVVFLTSWSGTMHPVDLARNENDFSNSVLFVQTLGGNYEPLMNHYSDYKFFEYKYEKGQELGLLTELIRDQSGSIKEKKPISCGKP